VKYASVLNIYAVADADRVYVATKYGIEPDAAIASDGNITYKCCVFRKVCILANLRGKSSD
jgi:hypothetical protein